MFYSQCSCNAGRHRLSEICRFVLSSVAENTLQLSLKLLKMYHISIQHQEGWHQESVIVKPKALWLPSSGWLQYKPLCVIAYGTDLKLKFPNTRLQILYSHFISGSCRSGSFLSSSVWSFYELFDAIKRKKSD